MGAFAGVLERLKTGKSTLLGPVVGALVGDLVDALVGPLVGPFVVPLVGPPVGRGSRSPALCVAHKIGETSVNFSLGVCENHFQHWGERLGNDI